MCITFATRIPQDGTKAAMGMSRFVTIVAVCVVVSLAGSSERAAAQIHPPEGYEAEIIFPPQPGFSYHDLVIDPSGGLAITVFARSRVPCESYIARVSPEGLVGTFSEPCIDQPFALDFNADGLLFFTDGAGFWDDIWTTPRGGTAADTQRFVRDLIVITRDILFGPDGNLYATDAYQGLPDGGRLFRITPEGATSLLASGFSTGSIQLTLAFDSHGTLYIADGGNGAIFTVSDQGVVTPFVTGLDNDIGGIAFLPNGDLLATGRITNQIFSISPSGTVSTWASGFTRPWKITADADGSVYVFDAQALWKIAVPAVDIDIKPGSDPNSVPCNGSLGTLIPVAILTTDDFDATAVDHSTVEFEGASELHVSSQTGELKRHEEDVDEDGDLDLLLHFTYGETALAEAECPSTVEAVLTGQTFDGQEIEGSDTVRLVLAFRGVGCGLGPELALLLPGLWWLRRRRGERAR
jgi:hypothetical protein